MPFAHSPVFGRTLAALRGQPQETRAAILAASRARARAATWIFALVLMAAAGICVAVLGMVLALFWTLRDVVSPMMLGVFAGFLAVALLVAVPLRPQE